MHIKKHLRFKSLVNQVAFRVSEIADYRQPGKTDYSLTDCVMSGLAMMHFQDSSMLEFQRRLEEKTQWNNLTTLFNVAKIPKETQMRDVL
ncbi:MAG: hypothetical protein AB1414_17080, partial [bacterium]